MKDWYKKVTDDRTKQCAHEKQNMDYDEISASSILKYDDDTYTYTQIWKNQQSYKTFHRSKSIHGNNETSFYV